MPQAAVGFIETRGLIGAIEAADAAAKAAGVELLGFHQVGGGLVTVRFRGNVAAVQTAVQAAIEAAARVAEVVSHLVIPAPADEVAPLLNPAGRVAVPPPTEPLHPLDSPPRTPADLDDLSVARLRQLARQTHGVSLKGREVSRAGREVLLVELRRVLGAP
ncbi:MAG: BMC domain-containing protein [Candidatus Latescibacterota bacterium]|jgi:ethanolamine utilization protein EutM